MPLLRGLVLLLLVVAAACFAAYVVTGQSRYKRLGLVILKWTLIAAFGFFSVLVLQRLI